MSRCRDRRGNCESVTDVSAGTRRGEDKVDAMTRSEARHVPYPTSPSGTRRTRADIELDGEVFMPPAGSMQHRRPTTRRRTASLYCLVPGPFRSLLGKIPA